ncbi:hypothetical protein SAMN02745171_01071 [Porphyromonas circumdentaria]|uniref:Helix-turn-helix domain-containing protein n=1 Tax=Porphyromonas circumdentaria TaxID=29524 RepID=A0A1T4NCS0_9PORP|nr:hypothetical protein [Porphyromonas circumdentaria]SJZ77034.1 hypothetical protein SAMN02745171_01071 [Porphyromonas circumdentaria]
MTFILYDFFACKLSPKRSVRTSGRIFLTGREVCKRLFISPRTLQDHRDKGVIPYPK